MSDSAPEAISVPQEPPAVVHVDGLALLKVIKHCHEALPAMASGTLLGMQRDSVLEITDCFVAPLQSEQEEADELAAQEESFEDKMMALLKESNVDNNVVGQFQAAYLRCNVFSQGVIEAQLELQKQRGRSQVMLAYDPMQTANGALTVSAYRLSDAFVALFKTSEESAGDFTQAALAASDFEGHQVLEEIPVRLHNSQLVTALMLELTEQQNTASSDFDGLDLAAHPFLEQSIQYVNAELDELSAETNKLQHYQKTLQRQRQETQRWLHKRRAENEERREAGLDPLPEDADAAPQTLKPAMEPSRLESLLLAHQIDAYCQQINRFAGAGMGALFLANALQGS